MNEHPISFYDEMVRAILAGEKTQSRRPVLGNQSTCNYEIGDHLWVREAFSLRQSLFQFNNQSVWYRASNIGEMYEDCVCWQQPKIMPRWASRIMLEVTSIRRENLHDISRADAIAEGFKQPTETPELQYAPADFIADERASFARYWDGIYSNWSENPLVWVMDFKVLTTPPEWRV